MMRSDPGPWPLLQRELVVAVQRRRTALVQVLTMVMTCAAAALGAALSGAFSEAWKQGQEPFGRNVMGFALTSLAMMLGFVAPALTATAITEERERRTLDLLLCTRLRPRDIVLAKLGSGFIQGMLLVAASLPAVAFASLWGGVEWSHVLVAYILVVLLMVLLLSLGVYSSGRAVVARQAVGAAYGIGVALMLPVGFPSIVVLALNYAGKDFDASLAGVILLAALVCGWLTSASVLGAITSISPVSRDPAPAARRNLLGITVTAVLAAVVVGMAAPVDARGRLGAGLMGALGMVLLVVSVLFLTEDPPARREGRASLPWRAHPVTGLAWVLVAAVVGLAVVPGIALREVAAPFVSVAGVSALVPFFASCAGTASLMRLVPVRRAGRRLLALAVLGCALSGPPVLSVLTGNLDRPPWFFMMWLHPVVMVWSSRPGETVMPEGPFGFPLVASFVVGHLLNAAVSLLLGLGLGKPAPRMDG